MTKILYRIWECLAVVQVGLTILTLGMYPVGLLLAGYEVYFGPESASISWEGALAYWLWVLHALSVAFVCWAEEASGNRPFGDVWADWRAGRPWRTGWKWGGGTSVTHLKKPRRKGS